MKPFMKTVRFLLAVLVIAAITHVALLYFGPSLIMMRVLGRMEKTAGGVNAMVHAPRPTAVTNNVVRSSPDLLYSVCPYDVGTTPLRILADVPKDTYWSVSFYDANTNNYRVINDGEATAGAVLLVVRKTGDTSRTPAGAEVINSPTERGLVLFRTLIADEGRFAEIDAARKTATCRPL